MTVTPQTLVAAYRRIAEQRMQGMPFVNPALQVEAVGFRSWGGHQVGILIAPWFMNLVLIPVSDETWAAQGGDAASTWEFPGGDLEFYISRPDGETAHLCSSLFTTVADFPDQETAREVAREILDNLLTVTDDRGSKSEAIPVGGEALQGEAVSRRGFLRRLTIQED